MSTASGSQIGCSLKIQIECLCWMF
jgi:hypothetical protein